jgi:tetratricopeptide (TPR) repeat protein
MVAGTDFSKPQNCYRLTSENPDYWRATLEMELGNQIIPATKIFMLISQGRFDEAREYLKVARLFSDDKTTTDYYLDELAMRLEAFYNQLNAKINLGIAEHDKGNFKNAMALYQEALKDYPNSAWARYELYYSQHGQEVEDKKTETEDMSLWKKSKPAVYDVDPLYPMNASASNRKEGFLLSRRSEIAGLFKNKDSLLVDLYQYAEIASDLGVYDFAGQVYWLAMSVHDDKIKMLHRFLYCMEKLGISSLKENFNGDFPKEFAAIDQERDVRMKSNALYQSMKE